jgi:hypothetical protein
VSDGLWEESIEKVTKTDKYYTVGTVSGGSWMGPIKAAKINRLTE